MAQSTIIKSGGTLSGATQVPMGANIPKVSRLQVPINGTVTAFTVGAFDYLDIVGRPGFKAGTYRSTNLYSSYSQPGLSYNSGNSFARLCINGLWIVESEVVYKTAADQIQASTTIGNEVINQSVILTGKRVRTQ